MVGPAGDTNAEGRRPSTGGFNLLAASGHRAHLPVMGPGLKLPSRYMTVAEFLDWDSGDRSGALWQLRDGEPEMMAPASDVHGTIQARLVHLLTGHLDTRTSRCRVVVAPGVIPRVRSTENCLVPDIGVTCARCTETPDWSSPPRR